MPSPDPALQHLVPRHSKSLTSRGPLGPLDLDPIQRLPQTALRPSGIPGQNDRRYGNAQAAWRPGLPATRTPRGPLSPEGRSGRAVRHGARLGPCQGGYGGGVPPWTCPRGMSRGVPHHPTPPCHGPRRARAVPHPQNGPLGSMASRGARSTGNTGNTGNTGYTGIQGIPGIREYGNTGNTGNTGIPGIPGIPGYPCIPGIPGIPGIQGITV